MLIGIYKLLNPVITIVDAVIAMEGPGPIHGKPKTLGWLAAAPDPIATEVICSDLAGLRDLPVIQTAKKLGYGCCDKNNIQIVGDLLTDDERITLEPAQLVPLRFTPLRIIKSIIRQIFIILKSK